LEGSEDDVVPLLTMELREFKEFGENRPLGGGIHCCVEEFE